MKDFFGKEISKGDKVETIISISRGKVKSFEGNSVIVIDDSPGETNESFRISRNFPYNLINVKQLNEIREKNKNKEIKQMKDFLGRELQVGDKVVVLAHNETSSTLYKAQVIKIAEKKVQVKALQKSSWKFSEISYKDPHKLVKVDF